jgi:hypothetical protein
MATPPQQSTRFPVKFYGQGAAPSFPADPYSFVVVPGSIPDQATLYWIDAFCKPRRVAGDSVTPFEANNTIMVSETATVALSGHRLISLVSGGVAYAEVTSPLIDTVLGFSGHAANAGQAINVQVTGRIAHAGWSWIPGLALFVGAGGVATQTVPVAGLLRQVGVAISATEIVVDLRPTVQLL